MSDLAQAFQLVMDWNLIITIVLSAMFGIVVGALPGHSPRPWRRRCWYRSRSSCRGAGARRHRHGDGHGDLCGRHSRRNAAYARHAGIRRVHRRELRDGEEGRARPQSRRQSRLLGSGRPSRRRRAHRFRPGPRGARHQLLVLRVFLAGLPRTHLRRVHRHQRSAQGIRGAVHWSADRLRGHRPGRGVPALHLRHGDAARGHLFHPVDDRHVRGIRAPALVHDARRPRFGHPAEGRQLFRGRRWRLAEVPAQFLARLRHRHGDRRAAGRRRGYRGLDQLRRLKKFSKEPEKFGTGHIEGIVDSTSANNSALGGAWIPAMVFGIPAIPSPPSSSASST